MSMARWSLAGILVLFLLISASFSISDKVVFLDVGQGDAILLQSGINQVLIDGGQGAMVLERLSEEMPWYDRKIEVVIATHPDRDHLEGLVHVLENYDVRLVLLPHMPHTSQLQKAWLTQLQTLVEAKEIDYRFGWRGQQLNVGSHVAIQLLGPFSQQGNIVAPGRKTNNAAVLTRVDFQGMSFLLTSDAEAPVEQMLIQQTEPNMLDVDVLKAGHHGSKTSTTASLLRAVSPKIAVISVGADNTYGHPHPTVLGRLKGIPTLRTDEAGSVRFVYGGKNWVLQCGSTKLFSGLFRESQCISSIARK